MPRHLSYPVVRFAGDFKPESRTASLRFGKALPFDGGLVSGKVVPTTDRLSTGNILLVDSGLVVGVGFTLEVQVLFVATHKSPFSFKLHSIWHRVHAKQHL